MPSCCPSVCPSRSCTLSKPVNIFSNYFHRRVGSHTILLFSHQILWQCSDGDPHVAKMVMFDQTLALGSMTAGAASVVNSFDRGVTFITAYADGDRHASANLVYNSKVRRRFYQSTDRRKRTEHNLMVRIGKSEATVTNNKRRHSRYCTAEANYWQARSIARHLCDCDCKATRWKSSASSIES